MGNRTAQPAAPVAEALPVTPESEWNKHANKMVVKRATLAALQRRNLEIQASVAVLGAEIDGERAHTEALCLSRRQVQDQLGLIRGVNTVLEKEVGEAKRQLAASDLQRTELSTLMSTLKEGMADVERETSKKEDKRDSLRIQQEAAVARCQRIECETKEVQKALEPFNVIARSEVKGGVGGLGTGVGGLGTGVGGLGTGVGGLGTGGKEELENPGSATKGDRIEGLALGQALWKKLCLLHRSHILSAAIARVSQWSTPTFSISRKYLKHGRTLKVGDIVNASPNLAISQDVSEVATRMYIVASNGKADGERLDYLCLSPCFSRGAPLVVHNSRKIFFPLELCVLPRLCRWHDILGETSLAGLTGRFTSAPHRTWNAKLQLSNTLDVKDVRQGRFVWHHWMKHRCFLSVVTGKTALTGGEYELQGHIHGMQGVCTTKTRGQMSVAHFTAAKVDYDKVVPKNKRTGFNYNLDVQIY